MIKREAQFQTHFNRWTQYEFKGTAVFELKFGYTSIPFSAVKEHQEHALTQAKHHKIVFKIPDFGGQNPFDSFCLTGVEAYVVLYFHDSRNVQVNKKEFFLIDIDTWIAERNSSLKKSIGPIRARQIGEPRNFKN